MFNIIFPSTGLLTSVGDQEALVNKVDAACNRNREKEDQSEESDERLRNEKSSSAAPSGASRAAPSKHFYSRLRKAKNGKVEADEFAENVMQLLANRSGCYHMKASCQSNDAILS